MKIAFLTPEYPHPETGASGGIGTSIRNLAQSLAALGNKPVILVYGQKEDKAFSDGEIKVIRIKNIKFKGLSWYLTRKKIQSVINKMYDAGEIDVVEVPDWTGIGAFMNLKCLLVVKLNGSDTYFCHIDKRKVKFQNRFLEKKNLQNADAHISVSRFTADLTNDIFGLNHDYTIITNGVDTNTFEPGPIVESNIILYFGTLIRKKGVLEIPFIFNKVVKSNPEAVLWLAGKDVNDLQTGKSTWELMQLEFTPAALAKVRYIGALPSSEIKTLISQSKICLFPSFAEAFPMAWLEAMAMQKTVIASNIGWASEVLEHGKNGLLCNPKEHEKFANYILEVLDNPKLNNNLSAAARQHVVLNFDAAVIARKSKAFYQTLLHDRDRT